MILNKTAFSKQSIALMQKIISRENQKIKFARRVREGFHKDLIFVEGVRLAEEALRSNLKIFDAIFTADFAASERGRNILQQTESSNLAEVSTKIFTSLAETKNSQGIILIGEKPLTGENIIAAKLEDGETFPLLVLLHQINNPSNLGAILRTAEAANAAGVITTKNSADVFSPKTLRGAMGAAFRISLWKDADFFEVTSWAKEKNFVSVCADVNAKTSYLEIDWRKPRLLIFGSEAHGLSAEEREKIEESLIVPMANGVESLNLAVSAGVILFEAKSQFENSKE
ncbi:MAG: TrmH family RNA methyltransferase [Pyrinomonadaceae bacterium]